ncbi:protoheme IX biogenesis protein HemY [Edwardsiella ictaluri]|uniref:HemY protein, putative n=2 Tax=Edwardsiella ictaluri TaxID=67780 RepID=C5BBC7_EDWI9|nr:protoheme IX biogenesis protein HemY [Edwardsiella ictaluri]ACR67362.1 HemY protein, putative [Edwardsiella ictaluri 93-146]ARD39949.1 protoheme IX biogenesis protein HemY [Edwardsiella ictaluri]AVZ82128.1 protoheme IX biogenesis protein HemY [Edwardsiella ictaluri]EKS7762700.1 protoheme IX biogenesis protein HemY [Edwardsiella ictaluri]EKS7769611.1 protoheme IX biogenesis protein HemY [Edwardsiella ictaluri]
MLKVLLLFIILIAGIVLGPMLAGHQGYVLIQTDSYNIETSVTSLVIMLILLMLALFALEWLLRRLLRTGARTRGWFIGRKRTRARRQTCAGLLKLTEGDYGQVEKLLARNADHADQPLVNYLLAAEAAQQRGDELRANQYLERAAEVAGSDPLPVDITRVRLQLARGENHAARHGVDALLNYAPRHPEVLRLAEQAYLRTDAFGPLLEILPALAKQGLHSDDDIEKLQIRAYIGLMDQAMANGGSEELKQWWKAQRRTTRHETVLQVALAEHLIECDDHGAAQQIVVDGLKRRFDERLVQLMPQLKSGNPEQLEKLLQQQIRQHGASALLNSTLGQLLMRHGEWQQAAEVLRAALKQRPDPYDYAWLADTLDKLHRPEEAAQMRRDGLLLTLHQDQPTA